MPDVNGQTTSPVPLDLDDFLDRLRGYAGEIDTDPLTNSVFSLAQALLQDLDTGAHSLDELTGLVDTIHFQLLCDRAERFRQQHAEVGGAVLGRLLLVVRHLLGLCARVWGQQECEAGPRAGGMKRAADEGDEPPAQRRALDSSVPAADSTGRTTGVNEAGAIFVGNLVRAAPTERTHVAH